MTKRYPFVLSILHNLVIVTGLAGFQVFSGTPRSTAWAGSWAEIQARGFLKVAVKDNWQPLGFREQGELKGFEIDLARRLAQDIFGRPEAVEWIPVTNVDRLSAVTAETVDLAIAGISVTLPRARLVDFSPTYYQSGIGVITQQSQIRRLGDLHQKNVAILQGSDAIPAFKSELPSAKLVGVTSYQAALEQLERGTVSAFVGELSVLGQWLKTYPQYRRVPGLIAAYSFAIALPKGVQYDPLRQVVRQSIQNLQKQGWLKQRAKFWGLPD